MSLPTLALLTLPLAAPGDWLEALLPILFVLFWVVSQVMNVAKALRGPARQQPPREPVARPAPPRPAPADAARDDLTRQIEAFRRAQAEAARPGGRPPEAAPPLPRAPRPQEARGAAPPPARPRVTPPLPQPPRQPAAPGSSAGTLPQSRQSGRPGTAPKPRPTGLGADAVLGGHAGEIARHVEGAFAHDLAHDTAGTDAGSAGQAPVPGTPGARGSTAADLAAMIRDPSTLRRVILLREILDRPVDRW